MTVVTNLTTYYHSDSKNHSLIVFSLNMVDYLMFYILLAVHLDFCIKQVEG